MNSPIFFLKHDERFEFLYHQTDLNPTGIQTDKSDSFPIVHIEREERGNH